MAETKFRFFEFGEFRLDAHRRILQKNGEPVHLTPRTFDLLCVMVENAGITLEHDELLDRVWEGTFVEQGNLKKAISTLRQALGDVTGTGEFITTVPRKGYRFTAPVRSVADETLLIRETKAEIIFEEEFDDQTPAAIILPAPRETKTKSYFSRNFILLVASIVLISGTVLAVWYFSPKIQNNFSVEKVRLTKILLTDKTGIGTLSGNGSFFAYNAFENGKNTLRVKHTATGSDVIIIQPMEASFWFPDFTPDENYINFYLANRDEPSKSGVYRIPTLGGAMRLISKEKYAGLKFSPDGSRLAAFRTITEDGIERQELLTIDADGNDERKILTLPPHALFRGVVWSPDGTMLTYGVKRQTPFDKPVSFVAEIPVSGGAEIIIMPEQDALFYVEEWLPDKQGLLLRQREANAEIFQIWQYFPASGEKIRVTNDDYSYLNVGVTSDGKTLGAYRYFSLSGIWATEAGNADFRRIAADGSYFYSLDWMADNRLVFSVMENAREVVGIMNADGTKKQLLTDGTDGIRPFPEFSRDGKNIVFMSERSGGRQVWSIDLDGRNLQKLTNTAGIGEAKMLSDGKTLIFTRYLNTAVWALAKQTAAGEIVSLSESDTFDWDISPDEKYIAVYELDKQTGKNRIFVREIESGAIVRSFDAPALSSLRWTRDGQALGYIRSGSDSDEIVLQPLDGAPEQIITTVRGEQIRNFCWSPDGRQIAAVRSKFQYEAILIQPETGNSK